MKELAYLIGADIHVITERLKQDFGLENYDTEELVFNLYMGKEAAGRSKPFPDLYLEAVRRLGIHADEVMIGKRGTAALR